MCNKAIKYNKTTGSGRRRLCSLLISAIEITFNVMRSINSRFTYFTYLLTISWAERGATDLHAWNLYFVAKIRTWYCNTAKSLLFCCSFILFRCACANRVKSGTHARCGQRCATVHCLSRRRLTDVLLGWAVTTKHRWTLRHRQRQRLDATFARWGPTRHWRSCRVVHSKCCCRCCCCCHANFCSERRYFRCRTRAPPQSRDLRARQQFVMSLAAWLSPSPKLALSRRDRTLKQLYTVMYSGTVNTKSCVQIIMHAPRHVTWKRFSPSETNGRWLWTVPPATAQRAPLPHRPENVTDSSATFSAMWGPLWRVTTFKTSLDTQHDILCPACIRLPNSKKDVG